MNNKAYCAIVTVALIAGSITLDITGNVCDALSLMMLAAVTFVLGL